MGTLFVVSTPIGNLKDITFRAVETLFAVDAIACEDTRRTGLLLENLLHHVESKSKPKLVSYYEQNEAQRIPEIISFLKNDFSMALVSDAGTPLISDPGFKLVRECLKKGIKVESLPGASSVLTALTSSGLPTDKFFFAGYPPHKSGHRKTFFENIKKSQEFLKTTVILFEAPHKLIKTLSEMKEALGDIEIVLAREMTKIHEELLCQKISIALEFYKKRKPKGEYVLLFNLS